MVGTAGFEPATTTPPVWCATRLRYAPKAADYTGIRSVRERLVVELKQGLCGFQVLERVAHS